MFFSGLKDDASQLMKGAKHQNRRQIHPSGKTNMAQIILDEVEIKSVVFFSKIDEKQGISSWLILTKGLL
jgi:carboxyl-terminal processing protease